jgi:hypothetical protein
MFSLTAREKDRVCRFSVQVNEDHGEEPGSMDAELGRLAAGRVPCFYLVGGIYSIFALKRVAPSGGRKPTFLLPAGLLSIKPA